MKINFNSFSYQPNFGAKSKEVRLADDIQRRAKLAFPLFSATYADEFYNSLKDMHSYKYSNAARIKFRISDKIQTARAARGAYVDNKRATKFYDDNADDFLVSYLKWNKNNPEYSKMGNCGENAKIALAGLFANGYYNSSMASLYYRASMIDKNTGEAVVSQEVSADHAFAVSDMNTDDEKTIVVDPWLGFAEDKKKALDIYNGYFKNEDTVELEKACVEAFKRNMAARGIKYKMKDYYLKCGFVFKPKNDYKNEYTKRIAGNQLRKEFPELILKKEDKQ